MRQPTKTLGTPRLFPKAAPTNGFSHKISAETNMTKYPYILGAAVFTLHGALSSCGNSSKPDSAYFRVFTEYERRDIDRELASEGALSAACRGESAAIQKILECSTTYGLLGGERSEGCTIRILTLMLYLGDPAFADAMNGESKATREAVGRSIDSSIVFHHIEYPLTRATYEYRANTAS